MKSIRVALAAVIATLTLAFAVGAAHADPGDTIGISPGGGITMSSSGRLTISSPLWTVNCNISLSGTLASSTVQSSTGAVIGSITSGTWTGCNTGTVALLFPQPWTIELVLPLPAGGVALRLRQVGMAFTIAGTTCLYGGTWGTSATDVFLENPSGGTNHMTFTRALLPRISGSTLLCGTSQTYTGTMTLSPSQRISLS